MRASTLIAVFFSTILAAAASAGGLTLSLINGWLPVEWFVAPPEPAEETHDHGPSDFVELTPQARANLGLIVNPVRLEDFDRTIVVPGRVIDRPGHCEAVVTAPAAGVITRIAAVPGEVVAPGTALFGLRLVGEELHEEQKELFKTTRELQIVQDERNRLQNNPSIPPTRLLELDYQQRRLTAALEAARQDLLLRGLTAEQLKSAAEGKFLMELTISAPAVKYAVEPSQRQSEKGSDPLVFAGTLRPTGELEPAGARGRTPFRTASHSHDHTGVFDLDELKVQPGASVTAGQALALLSNHELLDVEGHAFRDEAGLLQRAALEAWEVHAEFPDEKDSPWPTLGPLIIRSLSNSLEGGTQAFAFRLSLPNQNRTYSRDEKTYRLWRFRPGQRALLRVPVEKMKDVIVLPAAALVREAAEAYVFRQSGDGFQRRPVTVLYEDRTRAVLAHDGSVNLGDFVAQNAAAQLNRALKAAASGGEGGGGHEHHHHHHQRRLRLR